MISPQIHQSVDPRLAELQRILALVLKMETDSPAGSAPAVADNAASLRGLFYVILYGTLEYAITISVQVLLQEMTKIGVPFCRYENLLHAIALDGMFQSLSDPATKSKWPKRRDLLRKQASPEACSLNDTVFDDQLQNIWYQTLSSIFEYLCIPREPVPENTIRGYIDEIVDKRNEIAHGRQSALGVGRRVTSRELQTRLDAVTRTIDHVLAIFDEYLETRQFVVEAHRQSYLPAPGAPAAG